MKRYGITAIRKIYKIRKAIIAALIILELLTQSGCSAEPELFDNIEELEKSVLEEITETQTAEEENEEQGTEPVYVTETGIELDFVPDMDTLVAEAAEEIPEHECSWISYVSAEPTCTAAGERTYECEICGKTTTERIDPKGHNYENGVCTRCGSNDRDYKAYTDPQAGNAHYHSYSSSVILNPTCTVKGIRRYECDCGTWFEETIPATGHSYVNGKCSICGAAQEIKKTACDVHLFVTKSYVKPTCTTDGSNALVCINCGYVKESVLPATGHEYQNGVCTHCGENEPGASASTPSAAAHTHSYSSAVTKNPTCTQAGERTWSCSCGAYYTESIAATGHNYSNGTCTACGTKNPSVKTEKPAEHTHSWNGGAVTKEPTCCEYGIKTYTCTICGQTKAETLPMTDHVCDRSEYCRYCGTKTHTHLDAYGNYVEGVWTVEHVQQKTCQQDGIDRYTCIYCGMTGTNVEQAEHEMGADGCCIWCGYTNEDQWTHYGRQLKNSGVSGRQLCDSIAVYVASTGYGDCISFGSMCGLCADGAGIGWEFRSVTMVNCDGQGPDSGYHDPNTFVNGFCPYCGLGDNHHWVRLYSNDGCWYEYDCYAGDSYCVRGANTPRYGTR